MLHSTSDIPDGASPICCRPDRSTALSALFSSISGQVMAMFLPVMATPPANALPAGISLPAMRTVFTIYTSITCLCTLCKELGILSSHESLVKIYAGACIRHSLCHHPAPTERAGTGSPGFLHGHRYPAGQVRNHSNALLFHSHRLFQAQGRTPHAQDGIVDIRHHHLFVALPRRARTGHSCSAGSSSP